MWNPYVFLKVNLVDDAFYVSDLYSYMQFGDDIDGVCMYERCRCLCDDLFLVVNYYMQEAMLLVMNACM